MIIQARTTSHRLPGKAFLPLGGFPSALLCALRAANAGADVRVATSSDPSDDELAALLHAGGAHVARGSLEDVLGRFVAALDGVDDEEPVVRLTADNVFPDGAFVAATVAAFVASGARVLHAGAPGDGLPYGCGAQVARAADLRAAAREATDPADREHVFPWLVRRFGASGFRPPDAPGWDEDRRATHDTLADYLALRSIVPDGLDAIRIPWQSLCDRLAGREAGGRVPLRRGEPVLWLGTAQLGLSGYGIANRSGQPDDEAARLLLRRAEAAGAGIDTAAAYGTAERRIGRVLGPAATVPLTTKLDVLADVPADASRSAVRRAVDASVYGSLVSLRRERVETLLLHRWAHRLAWNGAAWDRLRELRADGAIGRLGASFDDPDDARAALAEPDVMQLQVPYNALDRRWDEIVRDAAARGRIVHARSVFLQGAIGSAVWPALPAFEATTWDARLREATRASGRDDVRSFAVAYALGDPNLAALVIGAETVAQLDENIARVAAPPLTPVERAAADAILAGAPEDLLVPSRWPA